jgi:hypothetical protein
MATFFLNRAEERSSASTIQKGSHKFAQKPDYMTIVQTTMTYQIEKKF